MQRATTTPKNLKISYHDEVGQHCDFWLLFLGTP